MPAAKETGAQLSARRSQREALERWLAEADALLSGQGDAAVSPVRGAA